MAQRYLITSFSASAAQSKTGAVPGFVAEMVETIRRQAAGVRAICALSGGVDSTVAAALVQRAIGDRLTNVFVDTGLLRRNEFRDTLEMLRDRLHLNVIGVDASVRQGDPHRDGAPLRAERVGRPRGTGGLPEKGGRRVTHLVTWG